MTTNKDGFKLTTTESGYATFNNGQIELTRFRPSMQWEFYSITQKGPSRGLPMFVRYLTDEEGARLTALVDQKLLGERMTGLFSC